MQFETDENNDASQNTMPDLWSHSEDPVLSKDQNQIILLKFSKGLIFRITKGFKTLLEFSYFQQSCKKNEVKKH